MTEEMEKDLVSPLKKKIRDILKRKRLSVLIVEDWDMFLLILLVLRALKNLCKLLRVTLLQWEWLHDF